MKSKYIILLLSAFLIVSCEKEIEFKGSESDPVITLNGLLMADSIVNINLSESRFFLDPSFDFPDIANAEVTLSSGSKTMQLEYMGNGNYTADYLPQAGEEIELKVDVPGFDAVHSLAVIPEKTTVGEISIEKSTSEHTMIYYEGYGVGFLEIGVSVHQDINIKIPVTDNGNEQNYYRLVVLKEEHYAENTNQTYLSYFTDPVFNTNSSEDFTGISSQYNRYNIFTDILFNGSTYYLNFSSSYLKEVNILPQYEEYGERYNIPDRVIYHIQVQQLSYDYYMYLKTRSANYDSDGNPFMEPIQIFSNIENGTGILGGAAVTGKIVEFEQEY